MQVGLVGLNFKTSDLSVRDKVARVVLEQVKELSSSCFCKTVAVITCNRTEIYFASEQLFLVQQMLLSFFAKEVGASCYTYLELDCVLHLCRVVSGLDSAILGETEIQHQVKCAYIESAKVYSLPSELHFLFQKALHVGKKLRSSYPQVRGMATLEKILWKLLQEHAIDLVQAKVLFVGASKTNHSLIQYFGLKGMKGADLCSRYAKEHFHCRVFGSEILQNWDQYDVIFSASKASHFLIHSKKLQAIKQRVLFDLSVPLTIEPSVGNLHGVSLYHMQQLNLLLASTQEEQKMLCKDFEHLLQEQADRVYSSYQEKVFT